jgi:hypothetical protein
MAAMTLSESKGPGPYYFELEPGSAVAAAGCKDRWFSSPRPTDNSNQKDCIPL